MKTELLVGLMMPTVGGVVSTTCTVWLQSAVLPLGSVARQVRVAVKVLPQPALVTVLRIAKVGVPQLSLITVGVSKVQAVPSSTVLLTLQEMEGGWVSLTITSCAQVAMLPCESVAVHR